MSSQHWLVPKCAKFHCNYAYSLEVTGRAFLTLLLHIKYATPDKPNNTSLTLSPKNQLPQVRQKQIFSICFKTRKTLRKLWKSLCCSFVKVYSYNDCFNRRLTILCCICTLLIGLFSSEKYWRVAKYLVFILKEVIQVTFYFYEILMKIQRKK